MTGLFIMAKMTPLTCSCAQDKRIIELTFTCKTERLLNHQFHFQGMLQSGIDYI